MNALEHWLHLDKLEDAQERATAIILYSIEGINLIITGLVSAVFLANGSSSAREGIISFGITLGLLALTWLGYLTVVRWLLPLMTLAAAVVSSLDSGSSSIALFIFPAVIAAGGLLLRRRGIVVFTVLSIAAVIGLGYVSSEPINMRVVVISILLGLAGAMNFLLVVILDSVGRQKQARERDLIETNQALQSMQVSLEQQVIERTQDIERARQEAEAARQSVEAQAWRANGMAQLNESMRGEQEVATLARLVISELCRYLKAQVGVLYLIDAGILRLMGSYAYTQRKELANQFRLGEGLVGQVALERQPIMLTRAPADYLVINSGLLETASRYILAAPFFHDGQVTGVVELGSLDKFTNMQVDFLKEALDGVGVAFNTAQARSRINDLLSQTQQQTRELQLREEELQATNDELQQQAQALRASQQRLQAQQVALEAANVELEEKTSVLQEQGATLDRQNKELRTAQVELERRAEDLALASRYKSEFLANMSHELRTPLNSMLILARMLSNNELGNLTPDQVESAGIIYNSGNDLLALINEILDLAKVEAGKMQFNFAPMYMVTLEQTVRAQFEHVAEQKGLEFTIRLAEDVPESIQTDQQRAQQIIKNLLSNAFKFTERGSVQLVVERPSTNEVAFRVVDTGIGMTLEQQRLVFEAFQQADGSTSRKYGGTGLGLTISRQLASHLGGRIELSSVQGEGSTFSLLLPLEQPVSEASAQPAEAERQAASISTGETSIQPAVIEPEAEKPAVAVATAASTLADDRKNLRKGDKILLVIEDDPNFAHVVYNYAHKKDFKCLVAGDGENGLQLVEQYHPDAIALDLNLPGMNGWQVLDVLKQNPDTRHIPVHIMSASEESLDAFKMGAIGFLTKPVSVDGMEKVFQKIEDFISRQIKSLLIVEDDAGLRDSVRRLLGGSDVKISEAAQGSIALNLLRTHHFDCMILDLSLPDMNGFEVLSRMNSDETVSKCPVVVYTGKALTEDENAELLKYANSVILKGVKSPERLLDETALFLHRVVADMPEEKQRTIKSLHGRDAVFSGKHVLVVDDDMRNAFALSKLLGEKGVKVSIARSGQKALETLDTTTDIDLVLMDIMMPEMDGYEAMRRIRAQTRFQSLPILALTAKAMKGDQEKCIVAGANDYLPKPVDTERLFSMMRVWLYK